MFSFINKVGRKCLASSIRQTGRKCLASSIWQTGRKCLASSIRQAGNVQLPQRRQVNFINKVGSREEMFSFINKVGRRKCLASPTSACQASSTRQAGRRERNVSFNDALNIFYLRLYGVRHMVKDHSDSERGNPLPPHRLLLQINSKGSFICTIPQTG